MMAADLRKILFFLVMFLPLCNLSIGDVEAASKHKNHHTKTSSSAIPVNRFSAVVVDASTGKVLYDENGSAARYPASLTKMMTVYLAFDALKKGKIKMDDSIKVSAKAAGQAPTNISLDAGDRLPVRTALESVVVRSANDSAMALAEALGGSEANFAKMMTSKARALGMKDTIFRNPNGLPNPAQKTNAYDMARLGIALRRDFPQYYPMFRLTEFTYNGVTYGGHNHVMARYDGVDGIKTGYIRASGFNLVTSVKRDGYSLVAVVMGGKSIVSRDNLMISMLERTFDKLESTKKTAAKNPSNDKTVTQYSQNN